MNYQPGCGLPGWCGLPVPKVLRCDLPGILGKSIWQHRNEWLFSLVHRENCRKKMFQCTTVELLLKCVNCTKHYFFLVRSLNSENKFFQRFYSPKGPIIMDLTLIYQLSIIRPGFEVLKSFFLPSNFISKQSHLRFFLFQTNKKNITKFPDFYYVTNNIQIFENSVLLFQN